MSELEKRLMKHIDLLVERYPSLESEKNSIISAYLLLEECYVNGGKLLVAGNGGSAADAEHIVGELMKGFKMPRKPRADFAEKLMAENQELGTVLAENLQGALPAIALDGHPALSTDLPLRMRFSTMSGRFLNPIRKTSVPSVSAHFFIFSGRVQPFFIDKLD